MTINRNFYRRLSIAKCARLRLNRSLRRLRIDAKPSDSTRLTLLEIQALSREIQAQGEQLSAVAAQVFASRRLSPEIEPLNMADWSFKQLAECTLKLLDLSLEVRCVNLNNSSTVAGKTLVRLEPSNRFNRIFSAITARDVDSLVVEHIGLLKEKLSNGEQSNPEP